MEFDKCNTPHNDEAQTLLVWASSVSVYVQATARIFFVGLIEKNARELGFPKSMKIAELTCIDFLCIGLEFSEGLVLWSEMLAKHTIFGD